MRMQADVLLLTVTPMESKAVLEAAAVACGQEAKAQSISGRIYFDLGKVNGAHLFLTRSEMGTSGLDASLQATIKGIEALQPAAVIMVGIAFGVNEKKQTIGDVLVTEQLRPYGLQRVGKKDEQPNIILRSDKPHASPWLINHFKSADLLWDEAKVRFGVILTGEKLVDNWDFREQLRAFEPEAIGGEMEGGGLYVACQDKKVDWILIKGICDWADGEKGHDKDARQQMAANNAVNFLLYALEFAPVDWDNQRRVVGQTVNENNVMIPVALAHSYSSIPPQPYFFGREKELGLIADEIHTEARSWGALIDGPGGIGKTALAIRAAHLAPVEDYPRKIFLSAKERKMTSVGEKEQTDYMLPNFMAMMSELAKELGEETLPKTAEIERANAVRRALAGERALIVIDNLETLDKDEQDRLYQFLGRLSPGCKAIVTSRRRSDVAARVVRLDRMEQGDALDLLTELARSNHYLAKTSEAERQTLYEVTNGNPLLLEWMVGQLGRRGSRCYTVQEACKYLENAPADNDPLEYIFGDLLDTFTESETVVLAALTHFSQAAKVKWIADIVSLGERQAHTALEDLADRALLVSDPEAQTFFLPSLAARFLRQRRPWAIAETGDRLADRAYALILENGFQEYDRFPTLAEEWPSVTAALPRILREENRRLQTLCTALRDFLEFFGYWDEWLWLSQEAERKAEASGDFVSAGWRAYDAGWVFYLRQQGNGMLTCSKRVIKHWQTAGIGGQEQPYANRLLGLAHKLAKEYPASIVALQKALDLFRMINPESENVVSSLNDLASVESLVGNYDAAENYFLEALRIARIIEYQEGIAYVSGNLADLALDREEWLVAERLAREALPLSQAAGRQQLVGADCMRLAKSLVRQDRPQEGIPYARRAVEIHTSLRSQELEEAQEVLRECEAGAQE